MKITLLAIIFILISWSYMKAEIENSVTPNTVTFPTFTAPTTSAFVDVTGGCGGFTECLEFIGFVVYDIALSIFYILALVVALVLYIVALLAILVAVNFTGFGPDAPVIVNVLTALPFVAGITIIIFKLARSGSSEA